MNPEIDTITPLEDAHTLEVQPQKAYAIKRWSQLYENAQTRRLKTMGYSILPRQLDSIEYRMLLQRSDGFAILTVWQALLQVAITCPQRGLLVTGGGPLRARELSAMTHLPEAVIASALGALESPDIGWLHQVTCPKYLLVSGSLRYGRKGRPVNPEFVPVAGVGSGPGVYIEWEYTLVDNGEGPDVERVLPPAIKKFLEREIAEQEEVAVSAPVGVHTFAANMHQYPSTTMKNFDHRCEIGEMLERLTFSREGAYKASTLKPFEQMPLKEQCIPCAVDHAAHMGMSQEDRFYFVMGAATMEDFGILLKTG